VANTQARLFNRMVCAPFPLLRDDRAPSFPMHMAARMRKRMHPRLQGWRRRFVFFGKFVLIAYHGEEFVLGPDRVQPQSTLRARSAVLVNSQNDNR
jgi:hypothetical protein